MRVRRGQHLRPLSWAQIEAQPRKIKSQGVGSEKSVGNHATDPKPEFMLERRWKNASHAPHVPPDRIPKGERSDTEGGRAQRAPTSNGRDSLLGLDGDPGIIQGRSRRCKTQPGDPGIYEQEP